MSKKDEKQEAKNIVRKVRFVENPPAFIRKPLTLLNGYAYAAVWIYIEVTEENVDPESEDRDSHEPIKYYKRERFIIRDDGTIFGELEAEGITSIGFLGAKVELPIMPKPEKTWSSGGMKRYLSGVRPDPQDVFNRLVDIIDRFIDFNKSLGSQKETSELTACYILGTWFLDAFTVIGYLWSNGQRGSGKTLFISLIAELGYLGELILAGSTYATLRDMADYGSTLAFDDAENYSSENLNGDKRALLLAGNRKGSQVGLKEYDGKKWNTRYVNTFCPRLFSAIKLPDSVLASRTIIIPLVRSDEDLKSNSDPADYSLWPHDRQILLDDLWAIGLSHLSEMNEYEREAVSRSRLKGRDLDPWRTSLTVALWLEKNGVEGLFSRVENLSWVYFTQEKPNLESDDLTTLVIKGLVSCAIGAISANRAIENTIWLSTKQITYAVISIVKDEEADVEISNISVNLVGKIMRSLRFSRRRPDGNNSRGWDVTLRDLRRYCVVYGIHFPDQLDMHNNKGINGINGINGTNSINHDDSFRFSNDDKGKNQIPKPCSACGKTAWKVRSPEKGGGWYCSVCHPLEIMGFKQE